MDATLCAGCGRDIPDFARVCEHCGHRLAEQLRLPALDGFALELPLEEASHPGPEPAAFELCLDKALEPPAAPLATGDIPAPVGRSRRRELMMITLAGVVGGAFTLALLMARAAPSLEVAAAPVVDAAGRPAGPTAPAHTPGWTTANSAVWVGHEKHSAAFELQAENTVSIWMRTVRPTLVVRCASGRIEAFVFTASATKIEPQTDEHTVRFSFDGGADVTERWPDSEEHDALFAPDGASLARRIAGARVMRFGFTPHNAAPVTAQFHVAGLAGLIEPTARECGWRK